MTERFYNFLEAVVHNSLSVGDTELSLAPSDLTKFTLFLAGDFTRVTLYDGNQPPEILRVIAVNAESVTVLRAQENTIARTWAPGSKLRQTVTAESFSRMANIVNVLENVSGAVVDTQSSQTLLNKTMTAPIVNGGTITGAAIVNPVFSGPAGTLPIASGGTGATTAADARVALGIDTLVSINSGEATLGQNDVLVVATPGISIADRFTRRFAQALEETVGTFATDTTLDMDANDLGQWEFNNTAPADTLTVADNGTTYSAVASWQTDNGAFSNGGYNYGITASCVVARGDYYWVIGVSTSNAVLSGLRVSNIKSYKAGDTVVDLSYTQSTTYSTLPADASAFPVFGCFEVAANLFCFLGKNASALEIWTRPITFTSDGSTLLAGNWSTKQTITTPVVVNEIDNVVKLSSTLLCVMWRNYATSPTKVYCTIIGISADGLTYTLKSTKEVTADVTISGNGANKSAAALCAVSGSPMVLVHVVGYNASGFLVLYQLDPVAGTLTYKHSVSTTGYEVAATSLGAIGNYFMLAYADNDSGNTKYARLVRGTVSTTAITVVEATSLGSVNHTYASFGAVVYSDGSRYLHGLWNIYGQSSAYRYAARVDTQTNTKTFVNSSQLPSILTHQIQSLPLFLQDVGGTVIAAFYKGYYSDYSVAVMNTVPAAQLAPWQAAVDQGYNFAITSATLSADAIGRVVFGNGGQVKVTTFTQNASGGAPIASSGTAANAFDGNLASVCTQTAANGNIGYDWGTVKVPLVLGICSNQARTYSLVVETSGDNFATAATLMTIPSQAYAVGVTKWFDLPSFAGSRYIRIREVGGATLDLQELFLSFGKQFQGRYAFVDFNSATAIPAGSWELIPFYSQGALTALKAGQTAVWEQVIDTSVWENFAGVTCVGNLAFGPSAGQTTSATAPNSYTGTTSRGFGVALTATSGVFVFVDQSAGYYLKVLPYSISGNTVTYGAFLQLTSVSTQYVAVTKLSDTQLVVSGTDSSYLRSWVVTYAANVVTAGAPLNMLNSTSYVRSVTALSPSAVLLGYVNSSNIPFAVVLSVSGTTLTNGTAVQVGSETSGYWALCCVASGAAIGVTQQTAGTSFVVYGLSISGTVVTVNSTVATVPMDVISYYPRITKVAENKAIVSLPCGAFVVQLTAGVPSAGNVLYHSKAYATSALSHTVEMLSETLAAQVFMLSSSASWQMRLLSVSGLQLAVKAQGALDTQTATDRGMAVHLLNGNKFLLTQGGNTGIITTVQGFNGSPYVGVTFDNKLSFKVLDSAGVARVIASSKASDHGGTDGQWYYRLATNAWASAVSRYAALAAAFAVAENQFGLSLLAKASEAEIAALGFAKSSSGSFGLALSFSGTTETVDLISIGHTSRSVWTPVAAGTYLIDYELEGAVRITKLTAGTRNVKGVVWRL